MDVVTFVAAWITLLVATTFGAHRVSLGGVAVRVTPMWHQPRRQTL